MQAKRPYGCSSTSFLTLLICLQCSDDDFVEGDVWRSVLYEPGGWLVNLLSVDFSRQLNIPSTIKKVSETYQLEKR